MVAQIRRDLYADVTSRILGYARVSTDGQTLDAQQAALAAAGAQRVFAEKISGAVTDRRQLAKALAALAPGDTLIVTKLDRLARSTRDLLIPSTQSAKPAQPFGRWAIPGPIPQRRMDGRC
jgi:predicted site-specific integrase-resolvase